MIETERRYRDSELRMSIASGALQSVAQKITRIHQSLPDERGATSGRSPKWQQESATSAVDSQQAAGNILQPLRLNAMRRYCKTFNTGQVLCASFVWGRVRLATQLTFHALQCILLPMNPSHRIARDLKACLVAGPILLLIWFARGCG